MIRFFGKEGRKKVNKNTLFAVSMILLIMWFFNSKFWYHNVRKRKTPIELAVEKKKESTDSTKQEPRKRKSDTLQGSVFDTLSTVTDAQKKEGIPESDSIQKQVTFDTIFVETENFLCAVSERGGRIISLKTRKYTNAGDERKNSEEEPIELINQNNGGIFNLSINEQSYDDTLFDHESGKTEYSVHGNESKELRFVFRGKNKQPITKRITFFGNEYRIGYSVESSYIKGKTITVGMESGITESEEKSTSRSDQYSRHRAHVIFSKSREHIQRRKADTLTMSGFYRLCAVTSKYFIMGMFGDTVSDAEITIRSFLENRSIQGNKQQKKGNFSIFVSSFSDKEKQTCYVFAGPAKLNEMKKYDVGLEKAVFGVASGIGKFFKADAWFPPICEFVLWLLLKLQTVFKDYGVVILILTVLLKIATFPLTYSSTKSMSRVQVLQPKITALRERYKGNPTKMNQELMELYRANGMSPFNMAGCLPMFLQLPVFISLYVVLGKAIELRGAGTVLIPWIHDLSKPEVIFSLPFSIPMYGDNFALIPILMAAVTYFQNKMTIKDPNQKAMIYVMPIFLLVLFNNFASGLVIYWTFSSVLGLGQHFLINKVKVKETREMQQRTGAKK